jgi:transposase InsO family protein
MHQLLATVVRVLLSAFSSRSELLLENIALRHQLEVLQRTAPKPKLKHADRLLWLILRHTFCGWREALLMVQPRTVIKWHRLGFRLFWRWKSRPKHGRPPVDRQLITLIRRMWQVNPTWGSRRIQAELAKLAIHVSDSTIRKYRPKNRRSSQTWTTFLRNHVHELVAIDFFTVPTATCGVLFVFLVLAHLRRKVLHFNVADAPSATWTAQQLVESFPYCSPHGYLLRDRDSIYGQVFSRRVQSLGLEEKVIAPRSHWQNPYLERLIGSIRRECLDHVVIFGAPHLRRTLAAYFQYYHQARTHRALEQDSPEPRPIERPNDGNVVEVPMVNGLHHRYTRLAA